jgi:hypothetical protein
MLDLWKIKRAVSQRSKRSESHLASKMYETFNKIIDEQSIKNAEAFKSAEELFLGSHPRNKERYADSVIESIRSGHYVINRPLIHGYGINKNNPSKGYVYIARSTERLWQLKIGYTTMDPKKRCSAFKYKYSYKDFELYEWIYCDDPVRIEKETQSEFRERLVNGFVTNDSREWYYINREEFMNSTERLSKILGLRIYHRSW